MSVYKYVHTHKYMCVCVSACVKIMKQSGKAFTDNVFQLLLSGVLTSECVTNNLCKEIRWNFRGRANKSPYQILRLVSRFVSLY